MKYKITRIDPGGIGAAPGEDLLVTADVTATVADLAGRLAGQSSAARAPRTPVTLRVEPPATTQGIVLDPASLLHESSLRSGCRVEVVPVGQRRPGDERDDAPVALVRIVSGPGAGREFRIAAGVNLIGRDPGAAVYLDADGDVSRRHATVTVTDAVQVADLNSANGVSVDGLLVRRAVVTATSRIRLGSTELSVLPLDGGHRRRTLASGDDFIRPPRVEAVHTARPVALPDPPVPADPPQLPVIALAAPALLGAALFAMTRQPMSLLFAVLSPVMLVGSWIDGRVRGRRRRSARRRRFDDALRTARAEVEEERAREVAVRLLESPSAATVADAMRQRTPLLWCRRPGTDGFLRLRYGVADLPSRGPLTVPDPGQAEAEDAEALQTLAREFRDVRAVPVVACLAASGALGVAGAGAEANAGAEASAGPLGVAGVGPLAAAVARALLVQAAGLHSPAELAIAAIVGRDALPAWGWLKWLPHVDSPHHPLRGAAALAADRPAAEALLSALESLATGRLASRDRKSGHPIVLVLVGSGAPAERSRLVTLAESGAGIAVIWTAEDLNALPAACASFVDVDHEGGGPTVGFTREARILRLRGLESIDEFVAETAARALSPVADSGARAADETDLPKAVALLDLYGTTVATDPAEILRRWTRTDSLSGSWLPGTTRDPGGLRAVVGQGEDGPFSLDLRADGPHALVAGTTGSGKSEFLQSWIMGLAAEYSPDRLTFLLVDYKGGAAFADCADLPHTVGLVTDLTPSLVRRALTSLRAELTRREHVLSPAGAKDVAAMEAAGDREAPPALVIVIDEFATLATEVPQFVDGMLDIAQRGRSLGLHLVLATQRPAGVITDSLRANTTLRVALRITDEADSIDVLGVPDAALFDPETPGRAMAARGGGRLDGFQSGYLGGSTPPAGTQARVTVQPLPFGPGAPWPDAGADGPDSQSGSHTGAPGAGDLARLARTIAIAADRAGIAVPRRPWVEPLPAAIDLSDLPVAPGGVLALGLRDEPQHQRRRPLTVDLDAAGNLALLGGGGSGLSTALRTVAATLTASCLSAVESGRDPLACVELYAIDCAGGGLALLEGLPTVGSVVPGTDLERVDRLLGELVAVVERRSTFLADARAASAAEYRAATGRALARVVLLLDGLSGFRAEHELRDGGRPLDRVIALASTGRSVGVHLIVTSDRGGAIPSALAARLGGRITLGEAAREPPASRAPRAPYDSGDVEAHGPPGRGVYEGDTVQLAVPGGSADTGVQAAALDELARRAERSGLPPTRPVRRLERRILRSELPATSAGRPVIGVAHDTLEPVGMPAAGVFVVSGPFGSGRTTAIRTVVSASVDVRPETEAFLLSVRESALTQAIPWTERAASADAAARLASALCARIETAGTQERARLLIVIEGVGDFEGDPAEAHAARLVKAARRAGVAVIAECDPVTAPTAWQLYGELKSTRAGLLLQPDESDGLALFRLSLPRVARDGFPAGRGYLVDSGRLTLLQIAVTNAGKCKGFVPV